ncbi:MAG: shikimate dehydrogenase [Ruminococcus sp.]|jgi:shikimate dehydrogenase|nr:shikimate dehydrogenase [Ruminococcus sp.]
MADKYGLLGYPLGHSRSPEIHALLFEKSKKGSEYDLYQAENLNNIETLVGGLSGFNVTIPYKTEIIKHINGLEGEAQLFCSVNTVLRTGGRLIGYNTDCEGFLFDLARLGFPFEGRICLIGCGGAGRMIAFSAAKAGCDLTISVRSPGKAKLVKEEIEQKIGISPIEITDTPAGHFDLLINCTPVGMFPNIDGCPAADKLIENSRFVYDLVYNPTETVLVKKALAAGKKAAAGLGMLVSQAAAAQTIWTGYRFSDTEISDVLNKIS